MYANRVRARVAGLATVVLMVGGLPAFSASSALADTATGTPPVVDVLSGTPGPTLVAPIDTRGTETNPLQHVVLSWDAVAGTDHYAVQISPNEDWTNNRVTLPQGGLTVAPCMK